MDPRAVPFWERMPASTGRHTGGRESGRSRDKLEQRMRKTRCWWVWIATMILICMSACDSDRGGHRTHHTEQTDSLRVTLPADVPADLVIGGVRYGYYCDLLQAYCDSVGRVLVLERATAGEAEDVSLRTEGAVPARHRFLPLGSTSYVVLAGAGQQPVTSLHELSHRLDSAHVWLAAGFQHTHSYDDLRDLLPATQLIVAADGTEPFGGLQTGEIDYLICERGEAAMAAALFDGIGTIHVFPEQVRIGLAVPRGAKPTWWGELDRWLTAWRKSDDGRRTQARYVGRGFAECVPGIVDGCRVVGGISTWDALFRKVGGREEVDWRLLSAIAYHESRFRAHVRSRVGAVGLMQIMPVTARHLGVGRTEIADPETNITLAARLLEEIAAQLELSEEMASDDRLAIVLAAYNSGVGTVRNARRLAEAEGGDPEEWETVSRALALMGDRTYRNDSIRYRHFRGSNETITFVNDVVERYAVYCRNMAE